MPSKKLTPEITQKILSIYRNNPHLGCRKIAFLFNQENMIKVSKSLVYQVVKTICVHKKRRVAQKELKGYVRGYSFGEMVFILGAWELLALEDFFENLSSLDKRAFSGKGHLKKAFFSYMAQELGLLDNLGFAHTIGELFFDRKVFSFLKKPTQSQISVYNTALLDHFSLVLAFKLVFSDGFSVFLDINQVSLWSEYSRVPIALARSLGFARSQLKRLLSNGSINIMQIFSEKQAFPEHVTQFLIHIFTKELTNIEIIDSQGKSLYQERLETSRLKFILGYHPNLHSYSPIFDDAKTERFAWDKENLKLSEYYIKCSQQDAKQGVMIKNVLLRQSKARKWCLLTNIEDKLVKDIAGLYLNRWPYLDEGDIFCQKDLSMFSSGEISSSEGIFKDVFEKLFSFSKKLFKFNYQQLGEVSLRLMKKTKFRLPILLGVREKDSGFTIDDFSDSLKLFNLLPIYKEKKKIFLKIWPKT